MPGFQIVAGPDILPVEACHVAARSSAVCNQANMAEIRNIPIPADLARAVPNRQLHYQLGRCCARTALAGLGVGPTIPGRDASGAPVWPMGVVGSISHTEGYARAAVASCSDARALGIDTERMISTRRARLVAAAIGQEAEVAVGVEAGLDRCQALTLAFSAKEALFKCLYPVVGRRFSFADARLVRVDTRDGTFTVRIATLLSAEFGTGATLTGRFAVESAMVHTGLLLRARATVVS